MRGRLTFPTLESDRIRTASLKNMIENVIYLE